MCRLYGFRSTSPRKVECELIRSQNSFIVQSREDEDGKVNAHGWGLAAYTNGRPYIRKQPKPAHQSEDFRWAAAEVFATDVLAHVRRATVAPATIENTHPFGYNDWTFIHNGEIEAIDRVRKYLTDGMSVSLRASLEGDTDSEYIFRYLLSQHERRPSQPLAELLSDGIQSILAWVDLEAPGTDVALNILMTNGVEMVGSRLGRKLRYVERSKVHKCEVCGGLLHINEDPGDDYRAVVIASERLTQMENWIDVPEGAIIHLDEQLVLTIQPIGC